MRANRSVLIGGAIIERQRSKSAAELLDAGEILDSPRTSLGTVQKLRDNHGAKGDVAGIGRGQAHE